MLKDAKSVLASGQVDTVVDYAIVVNREVRQLTEYLDEVKVFLRSEGVKQQALTGENSVEISGRLGVATVTGVKPEPKAKKGMSLASLEASLPPEVFAALFVKRIVVDIASDYEAKLPSLNPAQRAVLANFVEVVGSTPRVNLPK